MAIHGYQSKKLLALFILLQLFTIPKGHSQNKNIAYDITQYINSQVEDGAFMGTVLVAQNHNIILKQGYGYADIVKMIPNTYKTKFNIGSICKQFISTVTMMLNAENVLSLDDTINKYIPLFPHGDTITIHHLLTHSSGIYCNDKAYRKLSISDSNHSIVKKLSNKQPSFIPGSKAEYNSYGFILLIYIIELITQESIFHILKKRIFTKLKMFNTCIRPPKEPLPNHTVGYKQINPIIASDQVNWGVRNLSTTAEDLFFWIQSLLKTSLFQKNILYQMWKPYTLIQGRKWEAHYGYGFYIDSMHGKKRIFHHGSTPGFMGTISIFPESETCIIILSNLESFPRYQMVSKIAEIMLCYAQ